MFSWLSMSNPAVDGSPTGTASAWPEYSLIALPISCSAIHLRRVPDHFCSRPDYGTLGQPQSDEATKVSVYLDQL